MKIQNIKSVTKTEFGAKLVAGHINNLTSLEQARLHTAISNTLTGTSVGGSGCYYGCLGTNKTVTDGKANEKVSFEFGIGLGKSISFGKTKMWKVGDLKK